MNKSKERGVYKFESGGNLYYRLGNNAKDAEDRLHRELKRLGKTDDIKLLSKDKQ